MKKIVLALLVMGQMTCFSQNKTHKLYSTEQELHSTEQDSVKNHLDEVVVTANRGAALRKEVPVAISKLSAKLINETKPTALFEVINKTPGVMMPSLGNEQHMMAIRQPMTTNPYYIYLEDGLPIRPLGVFNHNALLEINQFNLQGIEVVKGPVSSIYGSEAVGGAVNLLSLRPSLDPQMKFGIQADQWGYSRFQAAAGATLGKFGFQIAGLTSNQKNSWMDYSDYRKDNINGRFEYGFDSTTRLIGTVFYGNYYSDMSSSVNENDYLTRTYHSTTDFTYRKSEALRARLTLEKKWDAYSNSFFTVFTRDNKLGQNPTYSIKWTTGSTTAKGQINSNNFKSYGAVAQHTQKLDFLESNLIAGATFDYSPVNYWAYQTDLTADLNPGGKSVYMYHQVAEHPEIRLSNYDADIYNKAAYLQYAFHPLNEVLVTMGGRYDNMSFNYTNNIDLSTGTKTYDKFTGKAGVNYNPFEKAGFYGNFSQGFAPPALTTVFTPKPGTGGSTGVPAQFYYNLKPAEFNNYEVGGWLALLNKKMNVEYSVYYMDGKNELVSVRLPDNSLDSRSAGKTNHKGIELGANYAITDQINLRAGGTYAMHTFVDFKVSDKPTDAVKDLNGKEMPSAPRWVVNSEVNYYPKWLPNFRTSMEWQLVSSFYIDQINTTKYPGYNIFNYRVGYQWKGLEFYGNIMNLTDKIYAYNVSKGNTATSVATYTPGAPRTFVFGLLYNLSLKKK